MSSMLNRRLITPWALAVVVLAAAVAPVAAAAAKWPQAAQAVDVEPWTTDFIRHVSTLHESLWWDDANGDALGVVERSRWNQPLRAHFKFTDASGSVAAEGIQPWGLGVALPSLAELQIVDAQQQPLALIQGSSFMASQNERFKIYNAHETYVADAWVGEDNDSITFSHPRGQAYQFATLARRPLGRNNTSRWRLTVNDDSLLHAEAWPVLVAFFASKLGAPMPPAAEAKTADAP